MSRETIRVLLVEDEEAHAELIRRAFESQQNLIDITVARNLREARESLAESLPDLAIVDLFLPDGRGLSLLEEDAEAPDYPVVVMTSHGNEEVAVEAMKAGALQYVVKSEAALADMPVRVESALRQWRHVIEKRQAEEARRRLEVQLRHSQRWQIIGSLASEIADEINNMLTPSLGSVAVALTRVPRDSDVHLTLEKVLSAVRRSRDLAEQILVFSHQGEHQRKPVELRHVVGQALKLLATSLPDNIEVRQEIDESCEPVLADPIQMHQVLMNLCSNAQFAMREEGGLLEVTLRTVTVAGRPHLELRVRDTGAGMDRHIRAQALKPFFTTRDPGEAHGLGLSVANGIVLSHGGELTVHSAPGEGTTVRIRLPAAADQEEIT